MDEKILQQAVEDVSMIKGVIDRTRTSFTGFSRIFIMWGVLFIFSSVINLIMQLNLDKVQPIYLQYPILSYVFPLPLIALAAALIYYSVSKKMTLVGLEKHLMTLWVLILILNTLPTRIEIAMPEGAVSNAISTITVKHSSLGSLAAMLFSFAIALIATSMLTGFKQPKYMAFVFIGISVLDVFFNISSLSDSINQLLLLLVLPFTFLYIGFFLKGQKTRGA